MMGSRDRWKLPPLFRGHRQSFCGPHSRPKRIHPFSRKGDIFFNGRSEFVNSRKRGFQARAREVLNCVYELFCINVFELKPYIRSNEKYDVERKCLEFDTVILTFIKRVLYVTKNINAFCYKNKRVFYWASKSAISAENVFFKCAKKVVFFFVFFFLGGGGGGRMAFTKMPTVSACCRRSTVKASSTKPHCLQVEALRLAIGVFWLWRVWAASCQLARQCRQQALAAGISQKSQLTTAQSLSYPTH